MTKRILLIGAGQIGRRYLQGIINVIIPLDIFVLDQSLKSLEESKQFWLEEYTKSVEKKHSIQFINSLESIYKEFDITIVCTTADVRLMVIKDLLNNQLIKSKNWILEKVLVQSESQLQNLKLLFSKNNNVFVNMPRRAMKFHREVKDHFDTNVQYNAILEGSNWGLACNSLHFLDLFSWWTGETLIFINTNKLNDWFESKRKGFFDIRGTLEASFSRGSRLNLVSSQEQKDLILKINSKKNNFQLNITRGNFQINNKTIITGRELYQSQLTPIIIDNLLINGASELTSLKFSIKQHKIFIKELMKHWNINKNLNDITLPIT